MAVKEDEKIILTSWANRIQIFIGRGDTYMFEVVEGGVHPLLSLKITDRAGADITTIASATFTMRKRKSGAKKIDAQACVISGTGPNLTYLFTAAQTAEVGVYNGRITLTHDTGGSPVEPIPELIEVRIRKAQ